MKYSTTSVLAIALLASLGSIHAGGAPAPPKKVVLRPKVVEYVKGKQPIDDALVQARKQQYAASKGSVLTTPSQQQPITPGRGGPPTGGKGRQQETMEREAERERESLKKAERDEIERRKKEEREREALEIRKKEEERQRQQRQEEEEEEEEEGEQQQQQQQGEGEGAPSGEGVPPPPPTETETGTGPKPTLSLQEQIEKSKKDKAEKEARREGTGQQPTGPGSKPKTFQEQLGAAIKGGAGLRKVEVSPKEEAPKQENVLEKMLRKRREDLEGRTTPKPQTPSVTSTGPTTTPPPSSSTSSSTSTPITTITSPPSSTSTVTSTSVGPTAPPPPPPLKSLQELLKERKSWRDLRWEFKSDLDYIKNGKLYIIEERLQNLENEIAKLEKRSPQELSKTQNAKAPPSETRQTLEQQLNLRV